MIWESQCVPVCRSPLMMSVGKAGFLGTAGSGTASTLARFLSGASVISTSCRLLSICGLGSGGGAGGGGDGAGGGELGGGGHGGDFGGNGLGGGAGGGGGLGGGLGGGHGGGGGDGDGGGGQGMCMLGCGERDGLTAGGGGAISGSTESASCRLLNACGFCCRV